MIWKTIAGRCIHRGSNGIQVQQNKVYRWLTFGSPAIQTLLNRSHPARHGLPYIQALTLSAQAIPASTCLLGLGGAGVAHALAPYLGDIPLEAVESNHEVIEIGFRYFMMGQLNNMQVVHQDAFLHVQRTTACYQHLIVDLFNAHSFPGHCNNSDFFMNCKRILSAEGILAVNLANLNEQWPLFIKIREHFKQNTVCIPIKGTANVVILAYKGKSIQPLLILLQNSCDLKQLTWDSKWGCVARI